MATFDLHELLSRTAAEFGEKVAVEWRRERVTYAEIEARSNKLANYLIATGINKQAVVALFVEDRVKLLEAILGVFKSGCAFAPFGTDNPARRVQAMWQAILPELVIIEETYLPRLASLIGGTGVKVKVLILGGSGEGHDLPDNLIELRDHAAFESCEAPARRTGPDDMCYLYFTSGSTGVPKAVAGRTKGLEHFIAWEIKTFGVDAGYRVSQMTAPAYDAYLRDVFVPLCVGGAVCVPEGWDSVLDARLLAEWIDRAEINLLHCVPSVFRSLLKENLRPDMFGHLKYLAMAGEAIHPSEVRKWMELFGERVQLVNLYGPTELTMTKFFYFINRSDIHCKTISIGKPMQGVRAIILDGERNICDPGGVGEIYIRTPYASLGYYNNPEATRAVFVPNPFSADPNDLIYKTGDLGRVLPDGNFELLGRIDHQVKLRGLRVELGEIESVLKSHQSVQEAVVSLVGEAPDEQRLVAYVALDPEQPATPAEMRRFTQQYLPDHMAPSFFVVLERMPLTPSGKIDRNALPSPDPSRREVEQAFVPPTTETEKALAEIWSRVLTIDQVGVHDTFFHLGGHSLLATQVISRVRERFQIDAPLRLLFEQPTVDGLAGAIDRLRSEQIETEEMEVLELVRQLSESEMDLLLNHLSQEEYSR